VSGAAAREPREPEEPALLSLVKELVDALGTLLAGHLRLARAELGDDARRLGRRASLFGLAFAIGLVGYVLLGVAAALALAPRWGAPLAFLALGAVHLAGASLGLGLLLRRSAPRPLDESIAALDRTVAALASPSRLADLPAPPPAPEALEGVTP
jgi:uncharacterized membrane protein YqjE